MYLFYKDTPYELKKDRILTCHLLLQPISVLTQYNLVNLDME